MIISLPTELPLCLSAFTNVNFVYAAHVKGKKNLFSFGRSDEGFFFLIVMESC